MTAGDDAMLAAQLTGRVSAVDGVARVFPEHAVADTVLTLVRAHGVEQVGVDTTGSPVSISARLGTSRETPTRSVIADVVAALADTLGDEPFALTIEIATIE